MKRIYIIFVMIVVFTVACATSTSVAVKKIKTDASRKTAYSSISSRPLWTRKFPAEEGYYVGIGSSNTGNEAEDMKRAEERARANIASAISTKIHEEVTIVTKDNGQGSLFTYAEDRVSSEVEQSLTGVETVDTYSSKEAGSWVYMRLSKELWEKTQKKEMADLIARITGFLTPVLNNYDSPFIMRVQQLVKARKLILQSPYPGMLETTFNGEKGALIDSIETALKKHFESLDITVKPAVTSLSVGKSLRFSLSVRSSMAARMGNFPFVCIDRSRDNKRILSGITDSEGKYTGEVKYTCLVMGKNHLSVLPSREVIGIDDTFRSLILPEREMLVDLQGITVGLRILLPSGMSVPGLSGAITSLFSRKNLPFKVDSTSKEISPLIHFELVMTDFPKIMEGAPDMAQVSAVISLVKKGKTVYSYKSKPVKDGGLTPSQAHKRAADKLMKMLSGEDGYVQGILEALALN